MFSKYIGIQLKIKINYMDQMINLTFIFIFKDKLKLIYTKIH